jgi:2',3'-cyclic-nucleotide 2'-phosphodiesterase (5'-nucleotidase family)
MGLSPIAANSPRKSHTRARSQASHPVDQRRVYTLENLPRLATLLRRRRDASATDVTLLVVAGDFLAPSLLSSLDAGRGMVECLNALGVTHVVLGNHEDDVPPADLHKRVAEVRAVCLGANVGGFDDRVRPYDLVDVCGPDGRRVRVGLVGTVMNDPTVYRSSPFGGAHLADANPALLEEASRLVEKEGCACVVAITHQSIGDDRALACIPMRVSLPVIVGGHEHVAVLEQVSGTWIVKAGMTRSVRPSRILCGRAAPPPW